MKQKSLFDDFESNSQSDPALMPNLQQTQKSPHQLSEICFDVEATGRNPISDIAVGISLCKEKGFACYVPVRHANGSNVPDTFSIIKPIFEDASIDKIGHNLKYDTLILRKEGIKTAGKLYDTMLASYLLNPNRSEHSLSTVGLEYLHHKKRPLSEVLGKLPDFSRLPIDEATSYAAEDAELTFELKDILFQKLEAEGLTSLYFDIEMPLINVLADIEEAGIGVDTWRLDELSKELECQLTALQTTIYSLAGEDFNINSPKQLGRILFDVLKLKPGKKTKTGYSTNVEVLEELAKSHRLPAEILNYRTYYKLKTTYVDALPKLINEKTGRIHTSFNQTVTATGRLSSSDPNMQNIPVRGEWGSKIRGVFIAAKDSVLISADYSQIELRILAHLCKDKGLIEAFRKNVDIHTRTASEIFSVSPDKVTSDQRRVAKTVNFGVIYGISPFGLSEALGISPKEASAIIDNYFDRHRGVKDYIDMTIHTARSRGYVQTLLGRKRPIPDINSSNNNLRMQAERMAINAPVQGTAADLIKIAMIRIWKRLKESHLKTKMILQIHDELLFEVPDNEAGTISGLIKEDMEGALSLSVPLIVGVGKGHTWAEAH
ncbi:MAG TPA: DNA polymerase I [Dissulfurispiraceae bacterium]|nr:DNA polymerase I [Dissulfurispiraceae bacterium]